MKSRRSLPPAPTVFPWSWTLCLLNCSMLLLQLKMNVFTNITALTSVALSVPVITLLPVASATNVWKVYYKELFEGAQAGSIPQDWCKGYEDGAVAITDLGPEVADGTAEKVAEVEAALKDGSLHVFDTSKFTVDGAEVTTAPIDLTYYDFSTGSPVAVYQGETKEAISDGYFHEGELRAAPTFALRIDGIIEDADPVA